MCSVRYFHSSVQCVQYTLYLEVWPQLLETVEEVICWAQPHAVQGRGRHLVQDLGGGGGRGVWVQKGLKQTMSQ